MAQLQNLPTDITADILKRLPVKSLLRFRCVNKPWCSLVDSQEFISLHLKHSLATCSSSSIIFGGLGVYTVDLRKLDYAQELNPPFKWFEMSNSINGLFLVVSDGQSPMIWNPSTRKYRALPDCPVDYPLECMPGSGYGTYGFGYDAKSDDYKVVKCVKCRGFDFEWMNVEVQVYSLRSNTWRKICVFPYDLPHKRVWGVFVKGALHCHFRAPESIMAFDFGNESHNVLPLPGDWGEMSEMCILSQLGGCLCVVNPVIKCQVDRIDIWMMKEYGVKGSWFKLFSVMPHLLGRRIDLVIPLAYNERCDKVLLDLDNEKLAWYDLERKTLRNVSVRNFPFVFLAETYVSSLVRVDSDRGAEMMDSECAVEKQTDQERVIRKMRKKRDDFLSEGFNLVL